MNGTRRSVVFNSLVAVLILTVSVSAKGQVQETSANRSRAQQLWEEALQAKGGRDRLHSVQNFLISGEILIDAEKGSHRTEVQWLRALPDKAWLYEYTPEFNVSMDATVINIERNFCMKTLSPAGGDIPPLSLCLPTTVAERLIQDPIIYLMETKWLRPVPIRTYEGRRGLKRLDVVVTTVGNLRIDFYLDRKTKLPVKLVTDEYNGISEGTHQMGLTVYFDDYATIDGIKMPRTVVREPNYRSDNVRRDIELLHFKFNVEFHETIFDYPASRKVKASDWKPRKED